jgi:hypothetical protein
MKHIHLISIFIVLCAQFLVWPAYAQEPSSPHNAGQVQYAPNQLIIQFAPGQAPHALEEAIQQEDALSQTLPGQIRLFFLQAYRTLQNEHGPAYHLEKIQRTDKLVGATTNTPMFDVDGQSQENTYLIELDGSVSVEKAIEWYENLEEVEYAQPNYMYEINTQL